MWVVAEVGSTEFLKRPEQTKRKPPRMNLSCRHSRTQEKMRERKARQSGMCKEIPGRRFSKRNTQEHSVLQESLLRGYKVTTGFNNQRPFVTITRATSVKAVENR
jgi:hypothetical protein